MATWNLGESSGSSGGGSNNSSNSNSSSSWTSQLSNVMDGFDVNYDDWSPYYTSGQTQPYNSSLRVGNTGPGQSLANMNIFSNNGYQGDVSGIDESLLQYINDVYSENGYGAFSNMKQGWGTATANGRSVSTSDPDAVAYIQYLMSNPSAITGTLGELAGGGNRPSGGGSAGTYTPGSSAPGGLANFPYGGAGSETYVQDVTNALADRVFGDYGNYGQQALAQMADSYNSANDLLNGDYRDKYNSYNQLLDELNSKLNAGYNEMQSYMPAAQSAADQANAHLGTLDPLLADQQNAYYDMGRDMEALRIAYQHVLDGTVPVETQNNLNRIYDNQMAQATGALNEQHTKDMGFLLDTLGGRGILSSTTSAQAQGGLNENLMRELQNVEYDYGTQKLQELIETPYKQFDKAAQLFNSSGQMVGAAGDIVQNGIGIQGQYNNNANNYMQLAQQANNNYNSLINASNSQASYGKSALDKLDDMIRGYQTNAGVANNIYTNVSNPALDMWSQLLNNETQQLISSQASAGDGGGSSSAGWLGVAGQVLPGLIDKFL